MKSTFLNLLAVILIAMLVIGCEGHKTRLTAHGNNVYLQFDLTNIEYKTSQDSNYSLVRGLLYADIGVGKSLNLDCFKIQLDQNVSESVYVNSVASILTSRLLANSDGEISVEVYWTFESGLKLEQGGLLEAKLVHAKNFEQICISDQWGQSN